MGFSNILLVLDMRRADQAQAFHRAVSLARNGGSKLTVCEVVDWVTEEVPGYITEGTVRVLTDLIQANRIKLLKEFVASHDVGDLDIAVKLLIGKPHIEVARQVEEHQHDLVIKQIAERRAVRLFSVAEDDRELFRSCPCPVWLVNDEQQGDKSGIVVALDMPVEGDSETGLNQHIVEISRSIALAESRPLHFVHAWHLRGESHMRAQCNPGTDLEVDRMLVRESARRKAWLRNTVTKPRSGIQRSTTEKYIPTVHVLNGQAKKVIPGLAEKMGAGLIVVGSEARTGISNILRRNTAETILPRSDCSLLVVKQPLALSSPLSKTEPSFRFG